jgi:hypothetical protein
LLSFPFVYFVVPDPLSPSRSGKNNELDGSINFKADRRFRLYASMNMPDFFDAPPVTARRGYKFASAA